METISDKWNVKHSNKSILARIVLDRYFNRMLLFVCIFFLVLVAGNAWSQPLFSPRYDLQITSGGRSFPMAWTGGLNSAVYGKVDLSGDGAEELILYDRSGNSFVIFEYLDGKYRIRPDLRRLIPPVNPGWVLWLDYDGDGRKDLFSSGDRGIVVHRNVSSSGQEANWIKVADPLFTTGFTGKINLIANAADVPAIADIDGDGDLDILVYNFAIGGYIRYNRNYSMELYGHADSLEFVIETREWGGFEECDCNLFAFSPVTCPDLAARVMHPGGKAMLAIDIDGDGDMDLLAGHEQCEELYFFENTGTSEEAFMEGYSAMFPDSINPANFFIFPAAFWEDFDGDGLKDLVVAPNVETNIQFMIDFRESNWFYRNTGSNEVPKFEFVQRDFLQQGMVDLGERSVPRLVDIDADGDYDLLVAANGQALGSGYGGAVHFFENRGSRDTPAWEWIDSDFLDLSQFEFRNPRINLVDLTGDNAPDLLYSGIKIPEFRVVSLLFENLNRAGEAFRFEPQRYTEISLPAGINDNPEFCDIDGDGLADLLLARQNGALEYYRNVGTAGNPSFSLVDGEYLGIGRDFSLERINLSVSVADLELDGNPDLIISDNRGIAEIYYDFLLEEYGTPVPMVLETAFSVDQPESLRFDRNTWFTAADLFGRSTQSLIAGNTRGGLEFYENNSTGSSGPDVTPLHLELYPNPLSSGEGLTVMANLNATVEVFTLTGQRLTDAISLRKFLEHNINLGFLSSGTYILRAVAGTGQRQSRLFVVNR